METVETEGTEKTVETEKTDKTVETEKTDKTVETVEMKIFLTVASRPLSQDNFSNCT